MKFQLPSFIRFIVMVVGMIGRVGLVNFNVTFYLSLVLSSHPPDEPLWSLYRVSGSKPLTSTHMINSCEFFFNVYLLVVLYSFVSFGY